MYSSRVRSGAATTTAPPPVFGLLGHPVRWRLVCELAESDRRVRELTERVDVPQNLASYHLGRLRRTGVVLARRSTYDGRDAYYTLDAPRCLALLADAGAALHPGLRPPSLRDARAPAAVRPASVLFLCTGNSARSQIAEALIRRLSGGAVTASSAGSAPKPLHPEAVRVLRERNLDTTDAYPKHLGTFEHDRFDFVITLCDRVREVCAEFPGQPNAIHWSLPDPSVEPPARLHAAFDRTAHELETRIAFFLHRLVTDPRTEERTA
jgi:protein-tyrosine-phosphatase/DNA-binding transcriptional ArsR family regulator